MGARVSSELNEDSSKSSVKYSVSKIIFYLCVEVIGKYCEDFVIGLKMG